MTNCPTRQNLTGRVAKQLFVHNIQVNSLKAAVYCYGPSASRYLEYALALTFLSLRRGKLDRILEVGCGRSILPMFWQRLNIETIVLDTNRDALKWQVRKSKRMSNTLTGAILADMSCLPFKNESFFGVSCISAIEHLPFDGDVKTACEIGRILKDSGVSVISFPLSLQRRSHFKHHYAAEIPPVMQNLFGDCLPVILNKLQVDRTSSYFERFFSLEDVGKRIIIPSGCMEQNYCTLKSGCVTKLLHQRIIPQGLFALLEYLIAKFLEVSKRTRNADAIVIKLKKSIP